MKKIYWTIKVWFMYQDYMWNKTTLYKVDWKTFKGWWNL